MENQVLGIKKKRNSIKNFSFCDSAGIQTRNLLIRSQMLYSVELQSHFYGFAIECDSAGIQTRNLLIRSQMLYSVELRSLISYLRVQK